MFNNYSMERVLESVELKESKQFSEFLERIGRSDLENKITSDCPWTYWTMEMYGRDVKGQGGLGILAADTFETTKKLGMPSSFYTLFYPYESKQEISNNFLQNTVAEKISPENRGFVKTGTVAVFSIIGGSFATTELDVYEKRESNSNLIVLTEPNLGRLYDGAKDSDHRLYQEVALGFGGYKVSKKRKEQSAAIQLNESATVFAALGELDDALRHETDFAKALSVVREKTLYTNHTLVQAAEAAFSRNQFERFVLPNIESEQLKKWLRGIINDFGGALKLSTLSLALADKRNGVSQIHAEESGKVYRDHERKEVEFRAVTNGISMERWGNEKILSLYRSAGILDEFNLPTPDYAAKIDALDSDELKTIKKELRKSAKEFLKTRVNQYEQPVEIPAKSIVFSWKRRMAEYKRPGMVFENPDKLARMLETKDGYLVIAGKAHQSDGFMQGELTRILNVVDQNPILKKRVHFVQNYDEDLAKALAEGADISLNTPRVRDDSGHRISTEACGTSWLKDVLGHTLLISTSDGGVADPEMEAIRNGVRDFTPSYFQISGQTYEEEVAALYDNMVKTADIVREKRSFPYADAVKRQLKAYISIMSGSRMEKDYLNLAFPVSQNKQ